MNILNESIDHILATSLRLLFVHGMPFKNLLLSQRLLIRGFHSLYSQPRFVMVSFIHNFPSSHLFFFKNWAIFHECALRPPDMSLKIPRFVPYFRVEAAQQPRVIGNAIKRLSAPRLTKTIELSTLLLLIMHFRFFNNYFGISYPTLCNFTSLFSRVICK